MKTNWTTEDRASFNQWCQTALGGKFLLYIAEFTPVFPQDSDLTKLALAGAEAKAYDSFRKKIDGMRELGSQPVKGRDYVDITDDPRSSREEEEVV